MSRDNETEQALIRAGYLDRCDYCGKAYNKNNGMARAAHMRKHVREGLATEHQETMGGWTSRATYRLVFTPTEAGRAAIEATKEARK